MKLKDGDYVLTEGAAWIETGAFAVRIRHADGGLLVEVYENGKEYNSPIDQCFVCEPEVRS